MSEVYYIYDIAEQECDSIPVRDFKPENYKEGVISADNLALFTNNVRKYLAEKEIDLDELIFELQELSAFWDEHAKEL